MRIPPVSRSSAAVNFDPVAIRRLVEAGKAQGLVRAPGEAVSIEKKGQPVAAQAGLRSQWMDIDPATAKRWLENNFRNRPIKEDVVQAYARDMINGVWVATHQGVAFNDKDELIDGQHRLSAIVLAGVTVRMMVTFGLPSKIDGKEMTTMDCVDRGRTRSVADQLTIQHGFKNGSITASICSSLATICSGERTRRLSVGQTLEIYRAFEHEITWVIMHRAREHGLRSAGGLAAFAFALATEEGFFGGATPIAVMFQAVMSGEGLKKGTADAHLRAFLTSDEAKLLTRGSDRGLAELVCQAIHLQGKGKPIEKLELSQEGIEHFRTLQAARVTKIKQIFQLPKA